MGFQAGRGDLSLFGGCLAAFVGGRRTVRAAAYPRRTASVDDRRTNPGRTRDALRRSSRIGVDQSRRLPRRARPAGVLPRGRARGSLVAPRDARRGVRGAGHPDGGARDGCGPGTGGAGGRVGPVPGATRLLPAPEVHRRRAGGPRRRGVGPGAGAGRRGAPPGAADRRRGPGDGGGPVLLPVRTVRFRRRFRSRRTGRREGRDRHRRPSTAEVPRRVSGGPRAVADDPAAAPPADAGSASANGSFGGPSHWFVPSNSMWLELVAVPGRGF